MPVDLTRRRLLGALAVASLPLPLTAQTDFPSKPIRIVVPFPAGGSLDNLARVLAAKMSDSLGQSVVVDPRPGGATVIGTQNVQKSPADGYSLLLMANGFLLTPMLMQKAPWDAFKDFAPVSLLARVNQVLVAHLASSHARSGSWLRPPRRHPARSISRRSAMAPRHTWASNCSRRKPAST